MKKSFDLTTKEGIANALSEIGDKDLLLLLIPGFGIGAYAGKKIFDLASSFNGATETTIEQQKKAAIEIIKQGKQSGASRIKVTLDQKAGFDFGSEVEGIPVKVMVGKFGSMTLEVEYK